MFLIKWDEIEGGTINLQYPEDVDIPLNVVQQIQISHNFIESFITIKEKNWNSISFYNENKETIIVLVLDKYADSSDYMESVEEFNKELEKGLSDEELVKHLKRVLNIDVFRTKDEVIAKLSNEVAQLKMIEYDYERRLARLADLNFFSVSGKVLILLVKNDSLNFNEIRKLVNTSKNWLEKVLHTLIKNNAIAYNTKTKNYFLKYS